MYSLMYSLMLVSRSVLYIKLRYSAVICCEEINNEWWWNESKLNIFAIAAHDKLRQNKKKFGEKWHSYKYKNVYFARLKGSRPTLMTSHKITRHRASTSTRWHFAFGLCCHSNETRAPIANPPNSAQLEGTPYHSLKLYRIRAEVWACGEGQTDTQTRVTIIHFASSTTHAKYNNVWNRICAN